MLRIRDWNVHFENNRTRELKKLDWVPIPNKMDGDGYTQIVEHQNGAAHLGVWIAIVEIASKCEPRGTLSRDAGIPHDAASLSRQSRLPNSIFKEAIPRLLKIGWLEEVSDLSQTTTSQEVKSDIAAECENPAPACGKAPMEWKGMEGNGIEEKGSAPASPSPRRKIPNTDHAKLIDHFKQSWEKLHGVEFVFVGGKDGKHFKWILEQAKSLQRAVEIVDVYLADDSQFVAEKFHPVGLLVSQFSVYHAKSATKKPTRKVGEKVVNWS